MGEIGTSCKKQIRNDGTEKFLKDLKKFDKFWNAGYILPRYGRSHYVSYSFVIYINGFLMNKNIFSVLSFFVLGLFSVFPSSASAQKFKVGAYYFGVFNSQNAQTYLGSPDQWVGARQLAQKPASSAPFVGETFPHLQPALGFYDNSTPVVLEKQIRQAKAAGLSYFNFYWYWNSALNGSNGGEEIEEGLTAFLNAKNSEDLDFAISITAHPFQNLGIPPAQYSAVISTIISKYLNKSNYLKTLDGRPIIYILDSQGIGIMGSGNGQKGTPADAVAFINQLRTSVLNQTGKQPFIVINSELDYITPKTLTNVDGYSCLQVYGLALDNSATIGSFAKYNSQIASYLGFFNNKPMIPCSMVDFNEKARFFFNPNSSELRFLRDWDINKVADNLTRIKNFSNSLPASPVSNYVNLYAWNEWQEGGVNIEPSELNGDRQLMLISSTFGLTTQGDANCKKYGNCIFNNFRPIGTLDLASCTTIAGWARDADTSAPTMIHVYKGGTFGAGGVFVGKYPANLLRSDLPFRDQKHGFVIPTPAAFKTGAATSVFVYAIDVNGNGEEATINASNIVVSASGRTIQCAP